MLASPPLSVSVCLGVAGAGVGQGVAGGRHHQDGVIQVHLSWKGRRRRRSDGVSQLPRLQAAGVAFQGEAEQGCGPSSPRLVSDSASCALMPQYQRKDLLPAVTAQRTQQSCMPLMAELQLQLPIPLPAPCGALCLCGAEVHPCLQRRAQHKTEHPSSGSLEWGRTGG